MIDIVIPYRIPPHGTHELQFALRSACEHYDVGRVFLLGDKPDWCAGVVHVPGGDEGRDPIWNVMQKLLDLTLRDDSPDEFFVWNDDMYVLQPGDDLAPARDSEKTTGDLCDSLIGRYKKAAQRTADRLGRSFPSFELHKPVHVGAEQLQESLLYEKEAVCWRTIIGSRYGYDRVDNSEPDWLAITADDVQSLIQGPWFASRDTMATAAEFVLPMRARFPDKCRFEV